MSKAGQVGAIAVVFLAGTFAGRSLFAGSTGREVMGVVLIITGFFASVSTTFFAATINRLEKDPPKEFSSYHANRIRRRIQKYKSIFWFRYGVAMCFALAGTTIGAILKSRQSVVQIEWLYGMGTGTGTVAVLLAILAIAEFRAVSAVLGELNEHADDLRRKNELFKDD